jgi:hypothetical protein
MLEDDKEPQNLLTEKFIEAEWKALREFRVSWSRLFALQKWCLTCI